MAPRVVAMPAVNGMVVATLFALTLDVRAAHPLISEDTGTQGAGGFEVEIGNAWARDAGGRAYELAAQLSLGVLPELDAILRPTWLDVRPATRPSSRGAGDTAIDIKWRFFTRGASSLAVRAGVNAPTGDASHSLGSGKTNYHGLFVASIDASPLVVHANLGYTRNRTEPAARRDLYHASAAAVWTLDPS